MPLANAARAAHATRDHSVWNRARRSTLLSRRAEVYPKIRRPPALAARLRGACKHPYTLRPFRRSMAHRRPRRKTGGATQAPAHQERTPIHDATVLFVDRIGARLVRRVVVSRRYAIRRARDLCPRPSSASDAMTLR